MSNPKLIIAAVVAVTAAFIGYQWFSYNRASQFVSAAYLSEGLSVAGMFKQHVAMHFQMNGELPRSNNDLDLPPPNEFTGTALTRAEVSPGGIITLTYNEQSGVLGGRIHLVPDLGNLAMGIRWKCLTSSYKNIMVAIPQCRYKPSLQLPNSNRFALESVEQIKRSDGVGEQGNESTVSSAYDQLTTQLDKLSSSNSTVRGSARRSLNAQQSASCAYPLLVATLETGSPEKKRAVAGFLAGDVSFGIRKLAVGDTHIMEQLARMLDNAPRELRISSIRAIRNLAGPTHSKPLLPVLLEILGDRTEVSEIRAMAVDALARLQTPTANEELIQFTGDYDKQVSKNAVIGLGTFAGSATSVNALRDVLFDRNSSVRLEAVEALDELGLQTAGVLDVFSPALDDPDVDIMLRVVRSLADERAAAVVPDLIAALDTSESTDVLAYALGEIGAPAAPAIPKLIDALLDPTTKGRPASIARAIDSILVRDPGSIDRDAVKSLADALPIIHGHALEYIISATTRMGGTFPEAATGLANWAALETADVYRRVEVLDSVGTFHSTAVGAVPALAKASNSSYPKVRQAAIRALASIGPATPGVVREIVVLIANRSQKQEAERALAAMLTSDNSKTVLALAMLVSDKRDDVREHSVELLGEHGHGFPQAAEALRVAKEDPRTRIAKLAADVLASWQDQ